ncbi:hypothetical protein GF342_05305 [Candidatus Woesearchaeota archaeon]|nr:hypothetical protein [Candidatus Woesearchaeota archaeon]
MKQHNFLLYALLGLLLISGAFFLRGDSHGDSQSYYHERIAQSLLEKGFLNYDDRVVAQPEYQPHLFHYFLVPFVWLFKGAAGYIVAPLLGFLCLLCLWILLQRLEYRASYGILLFIFSPLYLALFTTVTQQSFSLFLFLLSIVLFLHERTFLLSLLSFFALGSLSILDSAVTVLVIIVLGYSTQRRRESFLALLSVFLAIVYHASFFFFTSRFRFEQPPVLERLFFDFGAPYGISVFLGLLALVGLYVLWEHKRQFSAAVLALVAIIAYSIYNNMALHYAHLATLFLAVVAAEALLERRWSLPYVKIAFIVMLITALLSTASTAFSLAVQHSPDPSLKQSLDWLRGQGDSEDVVFTHPAYGHYITAIADKRVLLDNAPQRIREAESIWLTTLELLHTTDREELKTLIEREQITYILLTDELSNGLVWEKPRRGLAYATEDFEMFKKIYERSGIRLYKVQ